MSCNDACSSAIIEGIDRGAALRWHYPIYPEQCDITGIYDPLDRQIV
jgi:hypothetical protein